METKKLLDQIYLPPDIQFVPIAEIESRLWRGCIRFRNEEERATWGCNIQKNPLEKVVRRWRDSGALLVFAPGGLGRLVDGISDGVLRRPDFIKMVKDEFNLEVVDYSDEVPHAGTYSTPLDESLSASATAPETPKERRDRLLEWLEAETATGPKRGALARVFVKEKRTRPTADRANIGKEIKKARKERDAERRGGEFARLVRDTP